MSSDRLGSNVSSIDSSHRALQVFYGTLFFWLKTARVRIILVPEGHFLALQIIPDEPPDFSNSDKVENMIPQYQHHYSGEWVDLILSTADAAPARVAYLAW